MVIALYIRNNGVQKQKGPTKYIDISVYLSVLSTFICLYASPDIGGMCMCVSATSTAADDAYTGGTAAGGTASAGNGAADDDTATDAA